MQACTQQLPWTPGLKSSRLHHLLHPALQGYWPACPGSMPHLLPLSKSCRSSCSTAHPPRPTHMAGRCRPPLWSAFSATARRPASTATCASQWW